MHRTIVLALTGLCIGLATEARAASCESVATLRLANATVTSAAEVTAGAFAPPTGPAGAAPRTFGSLAPFCRVAATLTPSSDSDIKIEVWLPVQGWNGKFLAVGNGAWQGSIAYPAMVEALRRGYATSSTDTGHVGGSASFGMGHPEKVTDFAYRAVHEMTVAAKAIVNAFYERAPQRSYWNGCSAGGRQAMKAAQMFPADYDGIIAGSPGLDWTGRSAQAVRIAQALQKPEARLMPATLQVLHAAVVAACDGLDGVKDGLIENPAACTFDPRGLACTGAAASTCLTPAQVNTVRLIYSPIVDAKTKREIPGLAPGSELGWTELGWSPSARATGLDHFRYLVFSDPQWDVQKFDVATDVARLSEGTIAAIDARDPILQPFFDRGGKLLHYHGWSDPQITPLASPAYYDRVAAAHGGAAAIHGSYRLFLAPGMAHCSGGEGPNDFDELTALEQWVEQGQAPDRILASHWKDGKVDRTRPLCPYPQVASYTGTGSIDEAANFVCKAPDPAAALSDADRNLHRLADEMMRGRLEPARAAAHELFKLMVPQTKTLPTAESLVTLKTSVLLRFGRHDEILSMAPPPGDHRVEVAWWRFARGVSQARSGRPAEAASERTALVEAIKNVPAEARFGGTGLDSAAHILELATAVLDARIAWARGAQTEAITLWRNAVAVADTVPHAEPSVFFYPVRESLGAALLLNGDAAAAERVFRDDLSRHPRNPRSLFGLHQALVKQGRATDAALVKRQFDDAWKDADAGLTLTLDAL